MTGVIALIAGGPLEVAARLGIAMVCLQAAIGTANDIVDAPADMNRRPGKPIPAGLVDASAARVVLLVGLVSGLVLSAASGPAVLAVAIAGASLGFAYDVRLKGTAWSWLPFALGIPLLPVYAWLGGSGGLAPALLVLVVLAMPAGAALALANALADVERDRSAGTTTVATALGRAATWRIALLLQAVVLAVAFTTLAAAGGDGRAVAGLIVAGILVGVGLALGMADDAGRRTRGWELQGVGVGLMAAAWLAGAVVAGAR